MAEFDEISDALEEGHFSASMDRASQAIWYNAETGRYVVEPLHDAAHRKILEIIRYESD